ncbi:MAG TPA: hypothetical protein VMX35_00990, partial [Acidobacteriota bacterium]|nr:hypothetical protein [Acidobacteriota bacterium]
PSRKPRKQLTALIPNLTPLYFPMNSTCFFVVRLGIAVGYCFLLHHHSRPLHKYKYQIMMYKTLKWFFACPAEKAGLLRM